MEKSQKDFGTKLLLRHHIATEKFYLELGRISDCKRSLSLLSFDYKGSHFASVTKIQ